jgi:signal peptidase I
VSRLSDRLTRPSWAAPAKGSGSEPSAGLVPTVRLVTAMLARMVLTIAMSLTLWAAAPALLGWEQTTVVSGSMQPRIKPGDVVSARPTPTASLRLGMILLVDDPDHRGQLRLHRLVRFSPDGKLVLRGDANGHDDSSPVDRQAVHGVGSLRVPYVATPILWLHEKAWVKLAVLVAVILALVGAAGLDRSPTPPPDP